MELLASIRSACGAQVWSQGVKLVRADAVTGESSDEDEIVLRVVAPGRAVATTVVLYPQDDDWECDCNSKARVCAHVAAAAIALGQARDAGDDLPTATTPTATIGYRFARRDGGLFLDRVIVRNGAETPLRGTLTALLAEHRRDGSLSPTHDDIAIDRILADSPRARLSGQRLIHVLRQMPEGTDITLDGEAIRASHDEVLPRAHVTDWKDGAKLVLERDPAVTEVVAGGAVRCGDTLHPLGEIALTGAKLEALPLVQRYTAPRLGELVGEVLPALSKRIEVDVRTDRLPGMSRTEKPRLDVEVRQDAGTLSVMALLVYGSPAVARVDGDRLVHLGGNVPTRNLAAEKKLILQLRDELNLAVGRRISVQGEDAVAMARKLHAWSSGAGPERLVAAPTVSVRIDTSDGFDVWFETKVDGETRRVEAATVVRAWQDGIELVPVTGGGFAPLPVAWLDAHGHRVAALLDARDERGDLSTVGTLEAMRLCDALDEPRPPSFAGLAALLAGSATLPTSPLPGDLTATLRPYQRDGVNWLCFTRDARLGAVLADDMGLGKTLQALCSISGRTLVVCPRSVVHNWSDEIARFRPELTQAIYHGAGRTVDPDIDVTLTTYALLRLDIDVLTTDTWDTVILDEAQAIKNPDSQVARAAYRLRAHHRIALTGTPVENRLEELWSQMHFANPGLLGGRTSFRDRYAGPIGRGDPGVAQALRERIAPFLLRRLKRDVAPELPPRTDAVMYVELDETERSIYDAVRAATQKDVLEKLGQGGGVMAALEALLRLRQAACHAALIPGQHADASAKVERLVDALSEAAADGHKALVFSQWTSLLDLVEPHLRGADIGFTRLDGSTRDREAVVREFQSEDGPPVLLISLKAGGTGLNLTAADHVFLMDPWWNPAVEDQAADRTHRIGQDRPVTVYRLVANNTVEERILALQQQKRAIADAAIGDADRATSLTRDDLLALLA